MAGQARAVATRSGNVTVHAGGSGHASHTASLIATMSPRHGPSPPPRMSHCTVGIAAPGSGAKPLAGAAAGCLAGVRGPLPLGTPATGLSSQDPHEAPSSPPLPSGDGCLWQGSWGGAHAAPLHPDTCAGVPRHGTHRHEASLALLFLGPTTAAVAWPSAPGVAGVPSPPQLTPAPGAGQGSGAGARVLLITALP